MSGSGYMGSKYSKHIYKEGSVEDIKTSPEQENYDNLTKEIFWKEHLNEVSSFDKKQTMSNINMTVRG
jgi:hypothetical protein